MHEMSSEAASTNRANNDGNKRKEHVSTQYTRHIRVKTIHNGFGSPHRTITFTVLTRFALQVQILDVSQYNCPRILPGAWLI